MAPRSRLNEEEAMQRRIYGEDKGYQMSQLDMDEQARKLRGTGGGASAPAFVPPVSKTPQEIADDYGINARRSFGIRGGMGSRG